MHIVYHANPTQLHQIEHGEWLKAGIEKHGLKLDITSEINKPADIHIVSGPHYAKNQWVNGRTILLDRAYYHPEKSGKWASMDWVSLGWLTPKGRSFTKGHGRPLPEIETNTGEGAIYLCEYGETPPAMTYRRHPLDEIPTEPLSDVLRRKKRAIGCGTTALVEAALLGLEIECRDEGHILNNPDWLELLPYADWHYSEIESGEAWEHLCQ